jgi:hypothetical protein
MRESRTMSDEKFGRTPAEQDEIARECVAILEETARNKTLITNSDLAQRITRNLSLSPPVDHHLELSHILYDAVLLALESWPDPQDAPLLSAIAVYKDVREPGPGHITLAKQLGRKLGDGREEGFDYWWREVEALHDHYAMNG